MFRLISLLAIIGAIISVLLLLPVSADTFTNPPSFIDVNGRFEKTRDLSTTFTIGQTVRVSWNTSLNYVSLTLAHWDIYKGVTIKTFLS
jgi:hypothetical protein